MDKSWEKSMIYKGDGFIRRKGWAGISGDAIGVTFGIKGG